MTKIIAVALLFAVAGLASGFIINGWQGVKNVIAMTLITLLTGLVVIGCVWFFHTIGWIKAG